MMISPSADHIFVFHFNGLGCELKKGRNSRLTTIRSVCSVTLTFERPNVPGVAATAFICCRGVMGCCEFIAGFVLIGVFRPSEEGPAFGGVGGTGDRGGLRSLGGFCSITVSSSVDPDPISSSSSSRVRGMCFEIPAPTGNFVSDDELDTRGKDEGFA